MKKIRKTTNNNLKWFLIFERIFVKVIDEMTETARTTIISNLPAVLKVGNAPIESVKRENGIIKYGCNCFKKIFE